MSIYTITERTGTDVYDDAEFALAEWQKKQATEPVFVLQEWRFTADPTPTKARHMRSIESEQEAARFHKEVIVPQRVKTLEAQLAKLEAELALLKPRK